MTQMMTNIETIYPEFQSIIEQFRAVNPERTYNSYNYMMEEEGGVLPQIAVQRDGDRRERFIIQNNWNLNGGEDEQRGDVGALTNIPSMIGLITIAGSEAGKEAGTDGLFLAHNGIEHIPPQIRTFEAERIMLHDNPLLTLPPEIIYLELTELSVWQCRYAGMDEDNFDHYGFEYIDGVPPNPAANPNDDNTQVRKFTLPHNFDNIDNRIHTIILDPVVSWPNLWRWQPLVPDDEDPRPPRWWPAHPPPGDPLAEVGAQVTNQLLVNFRISAPVQRDINGNIMYVRLRNININ